MVCRIYVLTNKINRKMYVGQSWLPLSKRMGKNGKGYENSPYLYSAILKHGANNFEYSVLAVCSEQHEADKLEAEFIEKWNTRDPKVGYNLKEGGRGGKHSEETKLKMSQNASKPWLGKSLPDETKQKISEANTGNLHTEEWKKDTSEFMKVWHSTQSHPMQGKHHTEEAKAKISAAGIGRVMPKESIKRGAEKRKMDSDREAAIIKAYQNGQTIDSIEETFGTSRSSIYRLIKRNNIALSNNFTKWTGKEHSEETKEKMAQARTEYWKNKHDNT